MLVAARALIRRCVRPRSLSGWFLVLLSFASPIYNAVDAWSNLEFIEQKVRGGYVEVILDWLSLGWIQLVVLVGGLGWIVWSARNPATPETENPAKAPTVIFRETEDYGDEPRTGTQSHSPDEISLQILPELRRLRHHGIDLRPSVTNLATGLTRNNVERHQQAERDVREWVRETANLLHRDVSRLESSYFTNCTGTLPDRLECHIARLEQIIRRLGGANAI